MSLLNLLFGGSSKPRVTEKEYKKAKGELYTAGLSKYDREKVDEIFAPDFNMAGSDLHPKGLERPEIEARIKWMRENKSKHSLSDREIDRVEEALQKKL
jgi:hypothetical protein